MRNFRLILVCAVLLSIFATMSFAQDSKSEAKPNKNIKLKYNQSKNETTVTLKTLSLSNSMNKEFTRDSEYGLMDLDVSFTYLGKEITKPAGAMTLKFKSTAKTLLWQHAQRLVAVIDDLDALMLGDTKYSSNSQTFYMEEILTISVPYAAAQKIANAKTLSFQLGTRSIGIKNDQLEDLRAMINRMTP